MSGLNFFSMNFRTVVLVLILSLNSGLSQAKSVYDPFIQQFQVGTLTDPDKVELAWGYPAGLLATASIDTSWTSAGLQILSQPASLQSPHLSLRLLAGMGDEAAAASWIKWHGLRIRQLQNWHQSLNTSGRYLLAERLAMGFFRALDNGTLKEARRLSLRLASEGLKLGLPTRDVFVWNLRSRLLGHMLKEKTNQNKIFWTSALNLGTYDMGNAWVLWTAHRRLNGYPALPPVLDSKQDARKLSVLRKSWLQEQDIQNSAFSHDAKAGLGARLLKNQELNQHLVLYPTAPEDFTYQGWWVSGQRTSRRGEADYYEALASRTDLQPGWRMDLYRRASEIHLLNNRWEEGLKDLGLSLDKSGENSGSAGQRRRLRQWAEQALVLALANGDSLSALKIHTMATGKLTGEQKTVYLDETRHWSRELGLPEYLLPVDAGFREKHRSTVETGNSNDIKPVDEKRQKEFRVSSATPLWGLWAKWGLALCDKAVAEDLLEYRKLLVEIQSTTSFEIQEDLVVRAVSLLLHGRLDQEALLRWALDKDIHHLSGGQSLTAMSPMSGLARKKLNDPTALHALLGFALLADDMRGIVGVATPMPQTGLTKQEKLCFLYPLPRAGSIHQALASANNDPALLLAVARNESLFEPSVRSKAGALGWMQIMPFHFPDKGARPGADNWSCAAVSIAKGDALLKENRRRYKGNPYLTLAAYNAGPGAVSRWQKQLGDNTRNDIFLAWIGYPETRHYVEKVLIDLEIYHWIMSENELRSHPSTEE